MTTNIHHCMHRAVWHHKIQSNLKYSDHLSAALVICFAAGPPRLQSDDFSELIYLNLSIDHDNDRPDHTHERPDHTHERPDHAHERPDHTHERPDHAHGRPVVENVILDPDPEPPRPQQDSGWTYTSSILTFFFLTLGVVVVSFSIIILTIVCVNRYNRKRRRQKVDPPLLSEKEMLETMKKTGYVNPTYKFYTQQS